MLHFWEHFVYVLYYIVQVSSKLLYVNFTKNIVQNKNSSKYLELLNAKIFHRVKQQL